MSDLIEIKLFEGMTIRTVVETINMKLREQNKTMRFVEVPSDVDGQITFMLADFRP